MRIVMLCLTTLGQVDKFMHVADLSDHGKKKYCTVVLREFEDAEIDAEMNEDETVPHFMDRIINSYYAVLQEKNSDPVLFLIADNVENCATWLAHGVQTISNGHQFIVFEDLLKQAGLRPVCNEWRIPLEIQGAISYNSILNLYQTLKNLGF